MATNNNLYIDQGSTYTIILQVFDDLNGRAPIDLTNSVIKAQIRRSYTTHTVTAEFECSIVSVSEGTIRLRLSSENTQTIKAGRYVYDVMIYNNEGAFRASEGIITVYPSVTRE